ncbi:MAG TPA: hypothetical protein VM529_11005 [Gemmata sp.]|jgi:hypothetical protein|nr:hypothetical protein [Gemmata sp.]
MSEVATKPEAEDVVGGSEKKTMALEAVLTHPDLQMRVNGMNLDHAQDLADDMKRGDKLPPLKVLEIVRKPETGPEYFLYDGHHEKKAYEINGRAIVPVEIVKVNAWADAVLLAAGANTKHKALKRTHADKNRAVEMVLKTKPEMSNRAIAAIVKVSDGLVGDVRARFEAQAAKTAAEKGEPAKPAEPVKRVGADGKVYTKANTGAAKVKPKKKEKGISFDWKGVEDRLGWIDRSLDSLAEMDAGAKKHGEKKKCQDSLNICLKALRLWRVRIERESKAAASR